MRQTFIADNNLASAVTLMGRALEALGAEGLSPRSLFIAELVLEEMLTNTIKYAYDDAGTHQLEVVAEVADNCVRLELSDDGHYFDPSRAAPPQTGAPLSSRVKGGRGIHLVRKLVDRFEYRRAGDRNIVTVGFPAAAPGATGQG